MAILEVKDRFSTRIIYKKRFEKGLKFEESGHILEKDIKKYSRIKVFETEEEAKNHMKPLK